MSVRYVYSGATEIKIWGSFDVIAQKWEIQKLGVGQILFVLIVWILAGLRLIPAVRPLWYYCSIYYIVYAPIWIINIVMSGARSKELFLFAFFANLFVLVVTTFVFSLLSYNLVACALGTIPSECRENYLWDIVVWFTTLFLWFIDVRLFTNYAAIIGRIRQSSSIKGIRMRRPITPIK